MKVSVIIPIYNVEKYLRDCLDSVVSQTLRDVEIICVNDCTTDNSQEILDEYAAKDNRFVLLKHEVNRGLAGARNTGLAAAKGDYIYFVDSDDFLASDDTLEILYEAAVADYADEVIGGVLKWYEETDEKRLDWHWNYLQKEVHGQSLEDLPQLWANVVAWNKLLRRSFLEEHSIRFNENILKHEDNPFSVQVHILAERISVIIKTTYIYRQVQSGSIMRTIQKSDALNRCLYCYDIFKFIEADSKRHEFRRIFYPMHSAALIQGAEIFSRFSPSDEERMELMDQWEKIINLLPDNFPDIPPRQREIFEFIKRKEKQEAWVKSFDFFQYDLEQRGHELVQLRHNFKQRGQELVKLRHNFKQRGQELAQRRQELKQRGQVNEQLRQELKQRGQVNEQLRQELKQRGQVNEQLRQELERLNNLNKTFSGEIDAMHETYSWRITAPLRACFRLLRGD